MKKLLSTVLALAMLLSLVVVPVSADSYDGSGALADKTAAFTVEAGNDILYDNGGEQYVQFHIYVESTDGATPIRALSFKLDASDNLTLATKLKADNEDFWYDYPEAAALYKKQTDTDSTAFYSKFEYTPSSRYFAAAGSDEGKGIVERIEVMTICGKVTGVGDYTLNLTEVVAGDGEAPESVSQQFRREATGATVTVKAQPATNLLPMTMDKETVTVGEEFTVTLSHKDMTVSSFTASMNFKTDLLKVVSITKCDGYTALANKAAACPVSTVDEANNTGSIGIGAAASGDNTYAAAELLKVTFRALEAGETAIELEENSDGANGYIGDAQSLRFTVNPAAVTGVTVKAYPDNLSSAYTVSGQTVTVTYDKPCKVGYLGADGKYVAINAVAGDGNYTFTAPDGITEVVLVIKGDANGDGEVKKSDITRLNAAFLGKTSITAIQQFAGDVNKDGEIKKSDITQLNAAFLGKKALSW